MEVGAWRQSSTASVTLYLVLTPPTRALCLPDALRLDDVAERRLPTVPGRDENLTQNVFPKTGNDSEPTLNKKRFEHKKNTCVVNFDSNGRKKQQDFFSIVVICHCSRGYETLIFVETKRAGGGEKGEWRKVYPSCSLRQRRVCRLHRAMGRHRCGWQPPPLAPMPSLLLLAVLLPTSSDAVLRGAAQHANRHRPAFTAAPLLRGSPLPLVRFGSTAMTLLPSGLRLSVRATMAPALAGWPHPARLQQLSRHGCARPVGMPLLAKGQVSDALTQGQATPEEKLRGVGPVKGGWGSVVGLKEEEYLPEDPNLVKGALSNGLRYSILRNKVPPKRFYVNLEVHAGSIDETEEQQGLAHFLEHMLFLGSEAYPHPEDIRKVLTRLGMSQLADANAYTDFRSTVYTLSAPTYGTSGLYRICSICHMQYGKFYT